MIGSHNSLLGTVVLDGTQNLPLNLRDEWLALYTGFSVYPSFRSQQIAAYEVRVTNTIDPLAGSYYIEPFERPSTSNMEQPTCSHPISNISVLQ